MDKTVEHSTATTPMVTVATRVPLADFQRLVALAECRRMITTKHGRVNVSEAVRLVIALGLAVAEGENHDADVGS